MRFKYTKQVLLAVRVSVILIVLTALGVSGAYSAARAFAENTVKPAVEKSLAERAVLTPDPEAADAAGDQMTPSSRPSTEQIAFFSIPVIVKTVEDNRPVRDRIDFRQTAEVFFSTDRDATSPVGSSSLISSRLGRQFTLVGAKPSGTS